MLYPFQEVQEIVIFKTWKGKDPNGSSIEGTWTGKKN